MIPTSRCTIYPRYFYRRLFVQRAPKYQWQRRAVAVDHALALRAAGKKKKRARREEEKDARGGGGARRATAIIGDERREEEKMTVASTQRARAYIYLCVASRCWAFVVPDDGRLSRETTTEAFASSSSSRLRLLFLSLSSSLSGFVCSSLPNQFPPSGFPPSPRRMPVSDEKIA